MTTDLTTRLNLPSRKDLCDMTIIVDRSGSMGNLSADMSRGLAKFIADQRTTRGECLVSLVSFNYSITPHFSAQPSDAVPSIELAAGGGTALMDAVGSTIFATASRLAALPPDQLPEHVAIIIITDGWENSSTVFVTEQVRQMIEHHTTVYGWQFLFIGAHDIQGAKQLGIPPDHATTWTPDVAGAQSLFERLLSATQQFRLTGDCKLLPERN